VLESSAKVLGFCETSLSSKAREGSDGITADFEGTPHPHPIKEKIGDANRSRSDFGGGERLGYGLQRSTN
jgi:hypothetical protein